MPRDPELVPVMFVLMCCGPSSVADQSKHGDVYYRRTTWTDEMPWRHMPPAMERRHPIAKRSRRR